MKRQVTLAQLPGRTTDLLHGTVLAHVAADDEYTPLRELALTTGASKASAVYLGPDIAFADIAAASIPKAEVVIGDVQLDESRVVFENGRAKDDVIVDGVNTHTVEDDLIARSIYLIPTRSMTA